MPQQIDQHRHKRHHTGRHRGSTVRPHGSRDLRLLFSSMA
jgi:hypothetical protein